MSVSYSSCLSLPALFSVFLKLFIYLKSFHNCDLRLTLKLYCFNKQTTKKHSTPRQNLTHSKHPHTQTGTYMHIHALNHSHNTYYHPCKQCHTLFHANTHPHSLAHTHTHTHTHTHARARACTHARTHQIPRKIPRKSNR